MNIENTNNIKEHEVEINEEPVEEFEIVATKRTEIDKEKFFKLLAKHEELTLTIDRIGKIRKSNYKNNKGVYPDGCFIDYVFTVDDVDYKLGIWYNVGVPTIDKKYNLTSGFYIFKLLEIVVDLSKVEEITVNETFISNKLTGIRFKATLGTSDKGGFLIKPIELL